MVHLQMDKKGHNETGYKYESHLHLPFERGFDYDASQEWMAKNRHLLLYFVAAYLVFIFAGRSVMKNRAKFNLRKPLLFWNIGLAVFSLIGALRNLPEFLYVLVQFGYYGSACVSGDPRYNNVHGFWTYAFCLSKLPELGDTVFIVLRKQKLIFLHWYHHIVTAVYCWYTYHEYVAMNRWFVDMNLMVHAVMYSYYAARAMGYRPPKQCSMVITSLQIIQMILGTWVCTYTLLKALNGEACNVSLFCATISVMMYFSYFVLFVNLFIHSYVLKPSQLEMSNGKVKEK